MAGTILIATAALGAAPSLAQERASGPMRITVNHAAAVTLSDKAAVVMIADPEIADVVNERNNLMFVIGHKAGATNLLVYDNAGKRLFEREVVVTPPDASTVTITSATEETDYDCNPRCALGAHLAGGSTDDGRNAPPPPIPPAR
jgi:Flp pilus assembly secretin CpaC